MEMLAENLTKQKLASISSFINSLGTGTSSNPWSSIDIDRLELKSNKYDQVVKACRFFYQKDPIASSTINKLVEIGINEIQFAKNGLTDNELRIFLAIKVKLQEFAEVMALEYLISGLVVPEVRYGVVTKAELNSLGIKKYPELTLPESMFIRDSDTIEIKSNPIGVTYFAKIPQDLIFFIRNKGKYSDGTKDEEAYNILITLYPDFVLAVEQGIDKIKLEDDLIIRRKPQPNDPYPIPYLSAALESLKHKRNLRRMDYAIAARVIGAIQQFKLGDKDFPLTEDDKDEQVDAIKSQVLWRDGTNRDVERIFQLFSNHTLQIGWVVPPTEALLNEQKYISVNQDIIYALGFPRILITGETEKSGTSDPQYAMMSPSKTMENFRCKILKVIRQIVIEVANRNNLKSIPEVYFKPLTLFDHQTLLKSLADLYASGNLSRTTYDEILGYVWNDEMDLKVEEDKYLKDNQLGQYAPTPFSSNPTGKDQAPADGQNKTTKPSDIKNQSNNQ